MRRSRAILSLLLPRALLPARAELGKTVSFDLVVGEIPTNSRRRLRASVHVEALPGGIIPCVMPTVEIFNDDTGKATLFYPGAMIGE